MFEENEALDLYENPGEALLVNGKRKGRKGKKRRTAKQRAATAKLVAFMKAKRKGKKKHRKSSAPKKTRRKARKASHKRKRRSAAQRAATARLVAYNKAKKSGGKKRRKSRRRMISPFEKAAPKAKRRKGGKKRRKGGKRRRGCKKGYRIIGRGHLPRGRLYVVTRRNAGMLAPAMSLAKQNIFGVGVAAGEDLFVVEPLLKSFVPRVIQPLAKALFGLGQFMLVNKFAPKYSRQAATAAIAHMAYGARMALARVTNHPESALADMADAIDSVDDVGYIGPQSSMGYIGPSNDMGYVAAADTSGLGSFGEAEPEPYDGGM